MPRLSTEQVRTWSGYLLAASLSLWLSGGAEAPSAIWLANAFAVVQFARMGSRGLAPFASVLSAALVSLLLFGMQPLAALVLALTHAAQVSATVRVMRIWLGPGLPDAHSPERQIQLFAIVALAMPMLFGLAAGPAVALAAGWDIVGTIHEFMTGQLLGAAITMPLAICGGMAFARLKADRAARTAFAQAAIGLAVASSIAMTTLSHPLALIGLSLLVVAFVRPLDETGVIASICGVLAVTIASFGLVPGFPSVGAPFPPRLQPSLSLALVVPLFFAIVRARAALDRRGREESDAVFRRSMEDSAVGMAITDVRGNIQKVNKALADMLGYSIEELDGRVLADFVHDEDRPIAIGQTRKAIKERQTAARIEKRYLRKDGSHLWGQGSISAVFDAQTDRATHLICHIENIDERRRSMEAVAEAESRWNFALTSARQGVWEFDLRKNKVYHSAIWMEMLGYGEEELDDAADQWLELIHPDDLQIAIGMDRANGESSQAFFEAEFRMRHKDGHWVWVLDRGKVIERDRDGSIVRAIGTHTDISRQKEAQERLTESARALQAEKDRLRVMLRSIGDAVICTDGNGCIAFMNPVAEALTGHRLETAIGMPLDRVHAPLDEETRLPIPTSFRGARVESDSVQHRAMLLRPDGTRSFIRQVASPILSAEGDYEGTVIVFQDVSDARALQRQLAHAASHDSLTGLANRARFMDALEELTSGQDRLFGDENHLLFIDLDRFKLVNDTAGHVAGDALLKRIASAMQDCVRATDIVARLGGDEFAVILRGCRLSEAEAIARLVVEAIGRLAFDWEGQEHRVGASVGIAAITIGLEPAEIVADADKGCYAAKAQGRGTVRVHSRETEPLPLSA
ncbi:PAS domain S-box protein [Aquibium carbonis]|uniref:PAS domain S-box protein n=1 Tax=Aquibium carbonis TaxID=2495581 RepID=A0A3R9Y820_9HYPH|nr:PAS domain S-box protein [Aquibium carbonis]RST81790.1 PAS domain S-box protein [Aquibium carbonis]